MNVEQMKMVIKEILTKTNLTPCIVGHRGVGKTAGIIQVGRELGLRYQPLRLGQMEVGDLVGIPYREGDVMYWSRPCWWPDADDAPALIHCDELNRAQQEDTLQAIFQFVEPPAEGEARALHAHKLHPRHKVIVTINPSDGTYQVASLDRALIDRMVMIYVETDYGCWADYACKRDLDTEVRQFLAGNSGLLAKGGTPLEIEAEPTERGWEMVSQLRQACRFPAELEMEVYAGVVGRTAAVSFLRWLSDRRNRPVSAREVLENWEEVANRAAGQRDDAQAATMNDVIVTLRHAPQLDALCEQNLVRYVDVLPRDMRFGMVKELLKIPAVARALSQDKYDAVVLDALTQISAEASRPAAAKN